MPPLVLLALAFLVLAAVVLVAAGCRPGKGRAEAFMRGPQYRPACGARWLQNRVRECRGQTSGAMPSIETTPYMSWFPCCGSLGVPPPTYDP